MSHRPLALVVEDDRDVRSLLARRLERSGLDVAAAASGEAALALVDEARPDIVVLDLGLPGISGAEFLDQLRRRPEMAAVPVLVVSIVDPGPPWSQAVDGWLVKPFAGAQVDAEVRRLLVAADRADAAG